MIEHILNWMKQVEVGEGDLSTESVAPYALHSAGRLVMLNEAMFCGRSVLEKLLEPVGKQVQIDWKCNDGDQLPAGATVYDFSGNGAEILKVRRLIEFITGNLSGLATATRTMAQALKNYGKKLIFGDANAPMFEELERIAFITGGGELLFGSNSERIYLTQNHFAYAGGKPAEVIATVNNEIGAGRKKIKIEVECNTPAQFEELNQLDCDIIHLVGLEHEQLQAVFEDLNPNRKPIVHLRTLGDFRPEYTDYFFRYVAIEELHRVNHYLPVQLIFTGR